MAEDNIYDLYLKIHKGSEKRVTKASFSLTQDDILKAMLARKIKVNDKVHNVPRSQFIGALLDANDEPKLFEFEFTEVISEETKDKLVD